MSSLAQGYLTNLLIFCNKILKDKVKDTFISNNFFQMGEVGHAQCCQMVVTETCYITSWKTARSC